MAAFFENDDGEAYSSNFSSLNRNKRSIVIDFKSPEQLSNLRKLCAKADVIVENFRPGVLGKFGLDYKSLSQSNPKLVYCSISGYGQEGLTRKGCFRRDDPGDQRPDECDRRGTRGASEMRRTRG